MGEPGGARDLATDPPIIAHLRRKLAHEHEIGDGGDGLFVTLVGRSMRGLGVRPTILAHHEGGEKVYGLSRDQAVRVVARYDEIRNEAISV